MRATEAGTNDDAAGAATPVLVNEAALRCFELGERVGQTVDDMPWGDAPQQLTGVVADFHAASLRDRISPVVITPRARFFRSLVVRLAPEADRAAALTALRGVWQRFEERLPFTYRFHEDQLAALYDDERRLAGLVTAFAALAMLVACLGLAGLAAYTAEQRTKEIGIRKTLGATGAQIVALLTGDLVPLVAVALAVAAPVAYLAADAWLAGFAYRAALGPGLFLGAGLLAFLAAALPVGAHALRVARLDPVTALRDE